MFRFFKLPVIYNLSIVFFIALGVFFFSPRISFAQTCTIIHDDINTIANQNPCTQAFMFNRDCSINVSPTDPNRYTGNQCVGLEWPGETCLAQPGGGIFLWDMSHCSSAPTPTPTPTPTPSCGSSGNCADCLNFNINPSCEWAKDQSGTSYCRDYTNFCKVTDTALYPVNCSINVCPVPTSTPIPGVIAQQEQCNSSGTAWDIVDTNACVVSSACSVPPTLTPTPIPTCSSHTNFGCSACIAGYPYNCGWNGSSCQSGSASCPAGYPQWYWTSCLNNVCAAPTPTPTPALSCQVTASPSVHNLTVGGTGTITASVTSGQGSATINQMRFGSYNTAIATANPASDSSSIYSTTATCGTAGNTAVWATADLSDGRSCQSTGTTDTDIFCVTPTPTPTPTPAPCLVTTSPSAYNLNVGGTGPITATVANVPAGKIISKMLFGSYDTSKAAVFPPSDSTSLPNYSTTVTAVAIGPNTPTTAVWATAELDGTDTTTCQSAGATDTDINVSVVGGLANGSPCTINSQCLLNFCDSVTGTCQNPPAGPGGGSPTPLPAIYSISGKMFSDANENGKSGGDSNYTGTFSVSSTTGTVTYPAPSGSYLINNLPAGSDTVTFSGLSPGYRFTYPNTPGNSLIVNAGAGCSYPGTSEASCSLGNVINLNSGVTNTVSAWIQTIGADLRWDSGFNNPLPSSNTYASIPGTGGMPGVIYSGCSTPIFGSGQASQNLFNWQVGGTGDKCDLFTTTHSLVPTSYRFLLETAQGSGITPINITALDSSLIHGIYKVEGDFNLSGSSYTFGPGNFIILVNGNLNINQKIRVPVGSTAIFSVKGNITVNSAIGENSPASAVSDLEGLYSADNNFIVDGQKNCAIGPDLRLNIAGSAVANAGRFGGTFVNNRTLCAGNASNPTVSFVERPDFMLNYPSMTQQMPRYYQDVAP